MEKVSQLPVGTMTLDLWYEGSGFVVADKPQGMAVHPDNIGGNYTLVNGLLQSNRWLAEMETSNAPGVIHRLLPEDRGLVVVAKTDEMADTLRNLYQDHALTFSYRVRLPQAIVPVSTELVTVRDHQVYDQVAVWDIDSPLGDTERLRTEWLKNTSAASYFVAYQIDIPSPQKHTQVGLGDRVWLPSIDLYTVPPCSICNGTKALLSAYGFGYRDHTLDNDDLIAEMRRLRGTERGIPVVLINGVVSVGFDRHRLKHTLGLY
ncbi:MAG: pseudouridine synthase [Thermaerobacter sp.]|nr:pseudouridine synthase [Thermaerobacter sp.]